MGGAHPLSDWMQGIREKVRQSELGKIPEFTLYPGTVAELQFEINYSVEHNSRDLPSFLGREISDSVLKHFAGVGLYISFTAPHKLKRWTFEIVTV